MPYSIDIFHEHELGIARLSGLVTGETIVDVINDLYTHDEWQAGFNAVWDGRDIGELSVTMKHVTKFVGQFRHLDPYAGEGCTAVIVNGGMHYELAKLIEAKAKKSFRKRRVFRSFDAGIAWILAMDGQSGEKRQSGVRQLSTLVDG